MNDPVFDRLQSEYDAALPDDSDEERDEQCRICGNYLGECNPEAHAAERRAEMYGYWEGPERNDCDDRDYDNDYD